MGKSKIAAQLYTVREFCRTEEDICRSMEKIAKIGYRAVQISGIAELPAERMRQIMDGNGLEIVATHIGFDRFLNEADELIERHRIYGCKYPGIGSMPGARFPKNTREGFVNFAAAAEEVAEKLLDAGLHFVYHNHSFELINFEKGVTGLDIIFDNTKTLQAELDLHWLVAGGADPVQWITRMSGRADVMHFKDFGINAQGERVFREIGEGNMNWPAILAACEKSGVKWYIVEQDTCEGDPFDSLAISYKNLKEMGVE